MKGRNSLKRATLLSLSALFAAATLALAMMTGQQAAAQACAANVEDPFDLDEAAIAEIYACIGDRMRLYRASGPLDSEVLRIREDLVAMLPDEGSEGVSQGDRVAVLGAPTLAPAVARAQRATPISLAKATDSACRTLAPCEASSSMASWLIASISFAASTTRGSVE